MELQFTKDSSGYYVADFTATNDFNLHIERSESGSMFVQQKTAGDVFCHSSFKGAYSSASIDEDYGGFVYPKEIRIKSQSPVVLGVVTFAK